MTEVWIKIDLNWVADTREPAENPSYTDTPAYKTSIKGYTVPVHIPWGQPWTNPDQPEEYLVTEEEARAGNYLGGIDGSFWVGGGYSRMLMGSYTVHGPESWLDWWVVLEAKVVDLRLSQPPDTPSSLVTIERYDYFFEKTVSFSSLDYVWRLVDAEADAGKLFTPKNDTVDFNALKPSQLLAVKDGANLYNALRGDDYVRLPDPVDLPNVIPGTSRSWNYKAIFDAGDGQDTVVGSRHSDRISGGLKNDILYGGRGEDTFIFKSIKFDNSWDRFNFVRSLDANKDGKGPVVLPSLEGADHIFDGEIAEFQNGSQDLSAMKIVIYRTPDGHATGEVRDNGVLHKKLTELISGDAGPSTKPLKDMLWDTLTPIAAKSYSGHYRNNNDGGRLGERIELSGWGNGEGRIVEDGVARINVQIHSGRHNGNSEGCFLVNGTFKNALFDHLKSAVLGNGDFNFNERGRFYPVVPVVIEVLNDVPQTKIVGIDAEVTRPLAGKDPVTATVGFDVREFGLDHFRKSIDVFFTAEGRGWTFAKALAKAEPEGGTAHGHIWREGRNASGEMVYGIRIGVDAEGNLRSNVTFDVVVKAGNPREINFHIVDLDLWSNRGPINKTNWHLYAVSTDANDTDKPNGAEALLLTPLGSDGRDATIEVGNPGTVFANGAGELSAAEEFWL